MTRRFFKARFKPIKDLVMAGGTCTQEDIAALMLKTALAGQDSNKKMSVLINLKCNNLLGFASMDLV